VSPKEAVKRKFPGFLLDGIVGLDEWMTRRWVRLMRGGTAQNRASPWMNCGTKAARVARRHRSADTPLNGCLSKDWIGSIRKVEHCWSVPWLNTGGFEGKHRGKRLLITIQEIFRMILENEWLVEILKYEYVLKYT